MNIEPTATLLELVFKHESDEKIWSAVYALLARRPTTPQTVPEKAEFDTPIRSSSASIEQIHDEVDQRILEELTGRVYYDVGGFLERHFEGKPWTNTARDIYEESRALYSEDRWSSWPEPSLQDPFYEWFMKFQDNILGGLRRKYYTSANKVLRGSEANRKLDIFLTTADAVLLDEHDWSSVLVIGEHKRNPNEDGLITTLLQLAGYAREVFGSQPDRRFVPGFTICGSLMRLWVFDRSGAYSSKNFDIHKEPERFVKVIAGYVLMTDAELGLNTFIKHDGNNKYILARGVKISLEDMPIAWTKAIVCRGTTCYRGKGPSSTDWEYVVKFAWPSEKRQQEGRLLKLAKDSGVTGIAEYFHHEEVTIDGLPDTIANLRGGMEFGAPRKPSTKASWVNNKTGSGRANSSTRSSFRGRSIGGTARLTDLGISTSSATIPSSGRKRKTDGEFVDRNLGKRSRSIENRSNAADVETIVDVENREPDTTSLHSIQEAEPDSLVGCESETYGNRIHCCLIVSPAGRPLYAYKSVRELLEVFRDAIAGHKSLFEDGKILHRDISENNIIITESTTEEAPKGILIDLDLAKELNSVPSTASHRTGTMQFMAVEVLEGKGHTYRHDLESFLYVFLWTLIRYGHADEDNDLKPKKRTISATAASCLRDWYTGTYAQIARNKVGDMDKKRFENVIAQFAAVFEELKPLARDLRNVLFPIMDGAIFTGTYCNSSIMYDGMLNAFSRMISRLGTEEKAKA
jgi:hypothetical protein